MPSLDLLHGFVAVGRRMSITQAAADLFISQSALSKQVRALEEALGVRLLTRGHRSIAFTDEGARLFRLADDALQQLQQGLAGLSGTGGDDRPVTITTPISVAGVWLMPRIGRLRTLLPQVDVRLDASLRLVDLRSEGVELAIRYGDGSGAGAGWQRLFDEWVQPVALPALADRPLDAAHLRDRVLLEMQEPVRPGLQWEPWLRARGLRLAEAGGVVRCNHYDQLVQAALAGHGIALGRIALLLDPLADGRLQALPGHEATPNGLAYWLGTATEVPRPAVAQVRDWLLSEAATVRQGLASHLVSSAAAP